LLGAPTQPSAEHLVEFDAKAVGVDLANVPIRDVIAFRHEQGALHRKYARHVRETVRSLGSMTPDARESVLTDRHQEIADLAGDLRSASRNRFAKNAGAIRLGILGAGL